METVTLQEKLLDYVKNAPLEQLASILESLAPRLATYRQEHNGYNPRELFEQLIALVGLYNCAEVVVREVDANGVVQGYLLKQRREGELSWEDEYNIVGCTEIAADDIMNTLSRLAAELFGGKGNPLLLNSATLIGRETHYEPERQALCRTLVYRLDVESVYHLEDALTDDELWRRVTIDEIQNNTHGLQIVDHHIHTLLWANDPNRPFEVDLREGYEAYGEYDVVLAVDDGHDRHATDTKPMRIRALSEEEAIKKAVDYANRSKPMEGRRVGEYYFLPKGRSYVGEPIVRVR